MRFEEPSGYGALLANAINGGIGRTEQSVVKTLLLAFLAGAYIAIGGFLAVRVGLALPWDVWGSMGKFVFAAVFPLGLMLVVICGADLFTGNCMTLPAANLQKAATWVQTLRAWVLSWVGNFVGALFVAAALTYASGLIFDTVRINGNLTMPWASALVNLANGKTSLDFWPAFWRGVGCNWLVCLAVYLAYSAKDTTGKILALWFPTMAFVALGMEHCVANMFFIPAAIFAGTDPAYLALAEVGQVATLKANWSVFFIDNLIPVTLGNIVGGAVLVTMIYTGIHGKFKKQD